MLIILDDILQARESDSPMMETVVLQLVGERQDGPGVAETFQSLRPEVLPPDAPLLRQYKLPQRFALFPTTEALDEAFFQLTAPQGRLGYASCFCPQGFSFVQNFGPEFVVRMPRSGPRGTPQNRPVGVTSKPAS
jgi:hypothetical protein